MKSKQILTWIFSIFSLLLLAACTPSREQIAATMAVQTIEARVTGTAEIEQAVSRALTQAAPTLTPTPSATLQLRIRPSRQHQRQ
jgi:outer membrane lipopolysaccharide assembly protein LptE/RlpB